MELMTVTGYEKGIAGHEVVAIFDNIKVLKPTGNAQYQGFQILMSGKGCRNYENFLQLNEETWFDFLNRVCQYHINFPRIDLAIDDRKPYLSIPDLIIRTKEGLLSSKLRDIDFHDSGELKEEVFQSKGGSLYLGSSASNLRLVFYEKGYEQNKKYGTELEENWNRYELRFRQEMAVSVVQELLRYRDVAGLAMEVLNSKIRFLEKPTDSYTKITSNYYSIAALQRLPIFVLGMLGLDVLCLFSAYYFSKRRIIHNTEPIVSAVETLADGKPVSLHISGELSEIASSVNKASSILNRQNEARANWISGVSHDIRTPLSMIMGYAGRIAESKAASKSIREQAEIVRKQSVKIKELVQDLNLVSQLEYEMQPLHKEMVRFPNYCDPM